MVSVLRLSRLPSGEPEIFASLQGEGATCGLPSIFVRLALCNLRCAWCDTAYTWDWTRYAPSDSVLDMDPCEVSDRVFALATHPTVPISNVVITGGEPLLQQATLAPLAAALKERGMRIEIETNGTISPLPDLAACVDQWNASPKLASSENAERAREVLDALRWFAARPDAYLKFVVVEPDDLDEVHRLVERYDVAPDRVILMPEGTDPSVILERSTWLADACQASGYRLGTRLHILLWGDERGR
jgi:7-cyano-7-deazaguanosine (preQ0) biosynthesis protein QueE